MRTRTTGSRTAPPLFPRLMGLLTTIGLLAPFTMAASLDIGTNAPPHKECSAVSGTVIPKKVEGCPSSGMVSLEGMPDGNTIALSPFQWIFVLTKGSGLVIEQVSASPSFQVSSSGLYTIHSLVYDPATLDLSIVEPGVTTGFDVNSLLIQGGGDICGALDVSGASFEVVIPDAGTLSGGADVCLTGDAVTLTATPNGDSNTPDGYSLAYVLTSGTGLVIEQLGGSPEFTVTSGGLYTIHTFVFPSGLDLSVVEPGVTTGVDVLNLLAANEICASLDVAGAAFNVSNPNAGTLSGGADVCLTGDAVTLTATPNGDSNTPDGYSLAYVLTSGTGLVIEQLGGSPEFTVTSGGLYTIHTFVFPSGLDLSVVEPGVTTGVDVLNLLAANEICASLDVAGAAFNVSNPNAGTLSGGADVCLTGDAVTLTATPNGDSNTPDGYSLAYVLTSGTGLVIEQLGGSPEFTVTSGGLYTIHTFVFPSGLDLSVVEPGVTTGVDVLNLLAANEICASLDVIGAAFNVITPDAGTMTASSPTVCLAGGVAGISATANGDSNVPAGYSQAYVLTSGPELIIQQLGTTPAFEVAEAGSYTIHSFVFPAGLDLSAVEPGVTTGVDVLNLLAANDICASLDVWGAQVLVEACEKECLANSGTMSGGGTVCAATGATLTATPNGDANVPDGFSLAYVLTSGAELTIQQLGSTPEFQVNGGGLFTIHAFVFPSDLDLSVVVPGTTTGVDVLNLVAANDICASLDVAGAAFQVNAPNAGSLTADAKQACLVGGSATISATPNGNSNTPTGYSLAYVLTSGDDLVIQQIAAEPTFVVNSIGYYTIHTFVFPSDLDLSGVLLGITTAGDVLGLLEANDVCASLDVTGAPVKVSFCHKACDADAGSIKPTSFVVCRQGGTATLSAVPAGNAVVPDGYQTLYVLTRGPGLTITQVSATPEFTVQHLGLYRIHTLVYDPATLDLSIVQFGQTSGFDVNGLLVQGGGSICASLDVHGAPQIVLGPFICSFIHHFNHGMEPQNMDEMNAVIASGMNSASAEMVMNTIEKDLPLNVLSMYPNPTRDLMTIDMVVLVDTDLELSVLNTLGQEVLPGTSLNVGRGANRSVIDVSTLPSGSYLVRLTMNDRVLTQRFTKVD